MRTDQERAEAVARMTIGQAIVLTGEGATFREFQLMKMLGIEIAMMNIDEATGFWMAVLNLVRQLCEEELLRRDAAKELEKAKGGVN